MDLKGLNMYFAFEPNFDNGGMSDSRIKVSTSLLNCLKLRL